MSLTQVEHVVADAGAFLKKAPLQVRFSSRLTVNKDSVKVKSVSERQESVEEAAETLKLTEAQRHQHNIKCCLMSHYVKTTGRSPKKH